MLTHTNLNFVFIHASVREPLAWLLFAARCHTDALFECHATLAHWALTNLHSGRQYSVGFQSGLMFSLKRSRFGSCCAFFWVQSFPSFSFSCIRVFQLSIRFDSTLLFYMDTRVWGRDRKGSRCYGISFVCRLYCFEIIRENEKGYLYALACTIWNRGRILVQLYPVCVLLHGVKWNQRRKERFTNIVKLMKSLSPKGNGNESSIISW